MAVKAGHICFQMSGVASVLKPVEMARATEHLVAHPQILRVYPVAADTLYVGFGMGGALPMLVGASVAVAADRGVDD
jgi:hypothetical protein